MATAAEYIGLVTSEHVNQPNFTATIRALTLGLVDNINLCNNLPNIFDLDQAMGSQLDTLGVWVGLSRILKTPLTGVYFSWDTSVILGWDSGSWQAFYDSASGLIVLPDDAYRRLLRSKIAANNWDGTIPGAVAVYSAIFNGTQTVIIQDNQDMTFILGFVGEPLTAIDQSLLANGYIPLKPAGVRITSFALPTSPGPLFAWDATSTVLTGWDAGQWSLEIQTL